ncbi:sensor histidine kinase [Marinactinospora thermotolerans]|uniref:histidine kinase n=1 Tax=Marinactinospora thermotolerans DSM 45154 TaxID=1122192 RepID=A0A1T4P8V6_9ACTN|nr:sensor histidine kinase [Marinactinospora thermotolerans]SJZ88005.1 Signal transduction histidine kinase [Marinactinospora thermotolerans DSM 45154]
MAAKDDRADRVRLTGLGLNLVPLAVTGLILAVLVLVSVLSMVVWIGLPLLLVSLTLTRGLADVHRTIAGQLLGEPIPRPYLPTPASQGVSGITRRVAVVLRDPATWRDFAWLWLNGVFGLLLALLPAALFLGGLFTLAMPLQLPFLPDDATLHVGLVPVSTPTTAVAAALQGFLLLAAFWVGTPHLIRAHAHLARWLLTPAEKARLAARVAHLSASRADTVDAQASEIRRIERDLHDGAQARLVALGMSLGMAEEALTRDPVQARRMLAEARESTRMALTELRDLVRGIHPPVLVERGLEGAVQALAITQHLPIDVDIHLPGRLPDPLESAAYFAVAEFLANTAKHSGAQRAWVRVNHGNGRLVMVVGDDGKGGAQATAGGGLAGIRRRLSAFDGSMHLLSPQGGPTIVTVTLPLPPTPAGGA